MNRNVTTKLGSVCDPFYLKLSLLEMTVLKGYNFQEQSWQLERLQTLRMVLCILKGFNHLKPIALRYKFHWLFRLFPYEFFSFFLLLLPKVSWCTLLQLSGSMTPTYWVSINWWLILFYPRRTYSKSNLEY